MKFGLGIFFLALAYFLGCISPATIVAKMNGIDIRKEGSGNPGTTNVLRVVGKKQAAITLAVDVGKGAAAVLLGGIAGPMFAYGCAVMVQIGHCWPFQFKFKGGKGVAVALGAILAISPVAALTALLCFIVVVLITRYVSLGSCIAGVVLPSLILFVLPDFFWFAIIMACILIFKHRANIARLIHGEESKLSFHKKEEEHE